MHPFGSQFEREEVVREFEGGKKTYETWYRPLWGWIVDHLIDPELVQQFEWDAQKVFRFKDGTYTQIFTEPWTGKRFWDSQVSPLLFPFRIYLTNFKDVYTKRWEASMH